MAIAARFPKITIIIFFFLISTSISLIAAANLSVISHPAKLQLPLGDAIESSPGSRPGSIVTCNRIHFHGISRLRNLDKYAHSLKIRVSVTQKDAFFRAQTVDLCFHRNESIGNCMCPETQWQSLSKGPWVQLMSPFANRTLDIRTLPDPARSIEVSTEQEFRFSRLVFLILGFALMVMARFLSVSVVFYYGSFMTIGVILVILMVLFQGMKLLPTGRKSSLAIVLYSSIVGVATFVLHYLSGLLRSILLEMGISEDMHNPLGIFLLVCLGLAGAWFGYWGVRKLVLTDEGSVDSGVAYFVEWAILIFSAVMILQSSLDNLLAAQALLFSVMVTAIARIPGKLKLLRCFIKKMLKGVNTTLESASPTTYFSDYLHPYPNSKPDVPRARVRRSRHTPNTSPVQGLTNIPQVTPGQDAFYSTFHNTPNRKKFTKEEWEEFTKENTREALRELVSSPDFNKWAAANAENLTLTPPSVAPRQRKRRFFLWS